MIDIETPIVVGAIQAAKEISELRGEVRRLRALNAELLASCQSLCTWIEVTDQDSSVYVADTMVKVRAAIAHALEVKP